MNEKLSHVSTEIYFPCSFVLVLTTYSVCINQDFALIMITDMLGLLICCGWSVTKAKSAARNTSVYDQNELKNNCQIDKRKEMNTYYQIRARATSGPAFLWMDKRQTTRAMVMETAAELTASKVEEKRLSCKPQIVLTSIPKPSTTSFSTKAIFKKNEQRRIPEILQINQTLTILIRILGGFKRVLERQRKVGKKIRDLVIDETAVFFFYLSLQNRGLSALSF